MDSPVAEDRSCEMEDFTVNCLPGVHHLRIVDDRLWRGDAPSPQGYAALAAADVEAVIDLRPGADVAPESLAGMRYVHLPIRRPSSGRPHRRSLPQDDGE